MGRRPQVDVVDAVNMKWWTWCVIHILRIACRVRIHPTIVLSYIDGFIQLLSFGYIDYGTASELISSAAGGSGL